MCRAKISIDQLVFLPSDYLEQLARAEKEKAAAEAAAEQARLAEAAASPTKGVKLEELDEEKAGRPTANKAREMVRILKMTGNTQSLVFCQWTSVSHPC